MLGNTIGGAIGVGLVSLFGRGPIVLAVAVASVSWHVLLLPVLCGSVLLVCLAAAFSHWGPWARPYPLHWLCGLLPRGRQEFVHFF